MRKSAIFDKDQEISFCTTLDLVDYHDTVLGFVLTDYCSCLSEISGHKLLSASARDNSLSPDSSAHSV